MEVPAEIEAGSLLTAQSESASQIQPGASYTHTNNEAGALLANPAEHDLSEESGELTTSKPSDSSNPSSESGNAVMEITTVSSRESRLSCQKSGDKSPEHKRQISPHHQSLLPCEATPVFDRIGKLAIWSFLLGTAFILATIGFLSFLWFANYKSETWQKIIVHNWLTKLVTICSLILRHSADFQATACVAMIAGLMLERCRVSFPDSAGVSILRAQSGSGKIFNLLLDLGKQSRTPQDGRLLVLPLASLLALLVVLIQLVSFALISDVALSLVPGINETSDLAYAHDWSSYNFDSVILPGPFDTTWVRKPPSYATFAEYTETPFFHPSVVDTGVTLRAFLPFASTQTRESVQSFSGRATVVDTRVTCQSPTLQNEYVKMIQGLWSVNLTGQIWPSVATPRLYDATLDYTNEQENFQVKNAGVWFSCLASSEDMGSYGTTNEWKLSICQLEEGGGLSHSGYSGGLVSEFDEMSTYSDKEFKYGTAFIVLNFTSGKFYDWSPNLNESQIEEFVYGEFSNSSTDLNASQFGKVKPLRQQERGEWLDLIYTAPDLIPLHNPFDQSILSISLCYSGFSAADMLIDAYSTSNRTEPSESFDFVHAVYTYDSVREQLGQAQHRVLSNDGRGVLSLAKKSSWLANDAGDPSDAAVESPIQDFANMGGAYGNGNSGNFTGLLWLADTLGGPDPGASSDYNLIIPHHSHVLLFQEIVQNGGSIAFAIQSLLTVMASMTYYDHLPTFNVTAQAKQSFFIIANTPVMYRGFIVVIVILALHIFICAAITILFVLRTQHTEIGNSWQAVAQLVSPQTEEILAVASMMSQKAIDNKIAADGQRNAGVALEKSDGLVKLIFTE